MSGEAVLFGEKEIAARVAEMARQIAAARPRPDIAVPILAGAFVFSADLLRALAREGLDLATEFLWLRSYGFGETPGAVVTVKVPEADAIRGRMVLLIDGVLETGATLKRAKDLLTGLGAAGMITVIAVQKPGPAARIEPDYVCFRAGPEFLYGYGMDRAGYGRGLPDIRIRKTGG